ncbi:hypothetical protein EYF80_034290 [Liparis tanakae]|uniref:Uncharacterized protein n=1 Tax=Liparis tanakae TaxID=230148 RepID=A0A4Z2GPF6_9TELE|nr:hypothetical protein EYF80_034290 [Liparis tanakae]
MGNANELHCYAKRWVEACSPPFTQRGFSAENSRLELLLSSFRSQSLTPTIRTRNKQTEKTSCIRLGEATFVRPAAFKCRRFGARRGESNIFHDAPSHRDDGVRIIDGV